MTRPAVVVALVDRWREWRTRRHERRTGTGTNVPIAIDEFRKRQAYARVQQELKDSRGRW